MRAVIGQAWILRMRRFSRRKGVTEEEEEEELEEGKEEERNEEGNEEDEPVSNDDMEQSVIEVSSGSPRVVLAMGLDRHFGSGYGSEPNRSQICGPGRQ